MANVNETGIHGIGNGILMPQLANRWRLQITNSVPIIDEAKEILQKQITSFKFNYHLQLLEITIEQNINNNHLHTLIKHLSKLSKLNKYDDIVFVVEELDGSENVTGRFMFEACKMVDHEYVLDYSVSGACVHWLKFSFKKTQDLT
jgi:hypothetical protein